MTCEYFYLKSISNGFMVRQTSSWFSEIPVWLWPRHSAASLQVEEILSAHETIQGSLDSTINGPPDVPALEDIFGVVHNVFIDPV